jgi:Flp pilus assembly protein TadG
MHRPGQRRRPREANEDGSLALEYVFCVPLIFIVLVLIYAYGRSANVNGNLDAATRDAARAASQADSYAQASTVASRIVDEAMGTSMRCTTSMDTNEAAFQPGAELTVSATCQWTLTGLPGPSIAMHPTAQFTSIIDPYKVVATPGTGG